MTGLGIFLWVMFAFMPNTLGRQIAKIVAGYEAERAERAAEASRLMQESGRAVA